MMNYSIPNLKKSIAIVCLVSLAVFSCKDDDDPVINEVNLVGGTWTYDHADSGDPISSGFLDAFLEGTTYTFNGDGTYDHVTFVIGEVSSQGTWEYKDAVITLNPGDELLEETWEVTELSPNSLVYISTTVDEETEEETRATFFYTK